MPRTLRHPLLALACLALSCQASESTVVVSDSRSLLTLPGWDAEIGIAAWGPNWAYMSLGGPSTDQNGQSRAELTGRYNDAPAPTQMVQVVRQVNPQQLVWDLSLSSSAAQDYTMIALTMNPGQGWQGVMRAEGGGQQQELPWPVGRGGIDWPVQSLTFVPTSGVALRLSFSTALPVSFDGAVRIRLAQRLEANTPLQVSVTADLPTAVTLYPSPSSMPSMTDAWFPWEPKYLYHENNAFVLNSWNKGPAGAAGRVSRKADQLIYDGKPFRAWGLNICYASCAPEKPLADARANFYAAKGINAVRLHKYGDGSGWKGIVKQGSNTEFDPAMLDRMDYFIAKLKEKGIYVKFSNSFGSMSLAQNGWDRIPFAQEFGARPAANQDLGMSNGSIFLVKELQDLHIEQMTNLLQHTNPYTGLRYADDPAVMLVELVNEESALFGGTIGVMQTSATIRERTAQAFTAWLTQRFGGEEQVKQRWGGGLQSFGAHERMPAENFAAGHVFPVGAPWYWDPNQLAGQMASRKQRLLDTALFLKEVQDTFFDRYQAALRAVGYQGLVQASNWQAGRASSHFFNLHSDARFDVVDRHNYFGGREVGGSMLRVPGGGSLSSGMQQVDQRPFSLSEWIHVYPNQWGAEGPAIIAAYGMGLQGWDISFLFQNRDNGRYATEMGADQWEVSTPQLLAPFYAISRQVLRGDVKQSEETAVMNVNLDALQRGEWGFDDHVRQEHDIKVFDTDKVPAQTLAVARTVVRYTDTFEPTESFDLRPHIDAQGAYISSTRQLRWMPGDNAESGWFTMNTAGTQAFVGFATGMDHDLADLRITSDSHFAVIYVSAASEAGAIARDKRLILSASGRSYNRGMRYHNGVLLHRGDVNRNDPGPLLMEPITATITLKRPGNPTVYICDHDGNRTSQTISVQNGRFTVNGTETKTVFYEIVYP